ncbi:putative inactive shikimate kinase like 2, chloroplastic [Dichanthelium oligosanthes]|uniref:Putative inactive shikimate kinase like 2, chloroplastic n=1 Tax=Dichanthelium oligosanthes TaxID=888268 RepID=A0A1E5WDA8_9POAL|nr:putative inactive shikimate kinase like 2, chloroplastic [Dichanthelium oligosanthes]
MIEAAAAMAACSSIPSPFTTKASPHQRSRVSSPRRLRLPASPFRQSRSPFAACRPATRLRPRASVSASAAPSKDYEASHYALLAAFIDEDQLVVNLKKVEQELKWPDIDESWESLTSGITQLLTGISVHIVGDSTDINEAVAKEIAEGIGYLPVCTSELLESATEKSIDTWVASEGVDSVAEAESVVLESLSSHVRTVVATLGGKQGAASRFDRWQYLHSGFTVWLSVSDASDEATAREEARRSVTSGSIAYAKSDVVVKLGGWDPEYTRAVAQGCLVALKQLTLADKKLAGKKSLYIRLGCRGDWPNIEPPGWDPESDAPPTNV